MMLQIWPDGVVHFTPVRVVHIVPESLVHYSPVEVVHYTPVCSKRPYHLLVVPYIHLLLGCIITLLFWKWTDLGGSYSVKLNFFAYFI